MTYPYWTRLLEYLGVITGPEVMKFRRSRKNKKARSSKEKEAPSSSEEEVPSTPEDEDLKLGEREEIVPSESDQYVIQFPGFDVPTYVVNASGFYRQWCFRFLNKMYNTIFFNDIHSVIFMNYGRGALVAGRERVEKSHVRARVFFQIFEKVLKIKFSIFLD